MDLERRKENHPKNCAQKSEEQLGQTACSNSLSVYFLPVLGISLGEQLVEVVKKTFLPFLLLSIYWKCPWKLLPIADPSPRIDLPFSSVICPENLVNAVDSLFLRKHSKSMYFEEQTQVTPPKLFLELILSGTSPLFHHNITDKLLVSETSPSLRGLGIVVLLCPVPLPPTIQRS